jgi:hypothetical protein
MSPDMYELVLRDVERELELEANSLATPELAGSLGGRYFAAVMSRPAPGAARLTAAIAERLSEVLDDRARSRSAWTARCCT